MPLTKEVREFAKLLNPISADQPTGKDPRSDISPSSPYRQVKDARNSASAAERELVRDPNAAPPDWKPVRDLGLKLLAEQAKDLEITAFVTEALVRLEGFHGLRDGFRLVRELVEKFWDNLYPASNEEGLVDRVAPLEGLNGADYQGTLIAPISRVPLTEATSVGEFSLLNYNEGSDLKKITDKKRIEERLAKGAISLEIFQKAVAETAPEFYRTLVAELADCLSEFKKLGEVLEQRCGAGKGPPTSNISNSLSTCMDVVKRVAGEKWKPEQKTPQEASKPDASNAPGASPDKPAPGPPSVPQTREQALESLQKVAEFFRRTEPQSLLPYAIEQVVRWARMSAPELLLELIPDEAPRKGMFKQVGIRPEQPQPGPKPK